MGNDEDKKTLNLFLLKTDSLEGRTRIIYLNNKPEYIGYVGSDFLLTAESKIPLVASVVDNKGKIRGTIEAFLDEGIASYDQDHHKISFFNEMNELFVTDSKYAGNFRRVNVTYIPQNLIISKSPFAKQLLDMGLINGYRIFDKISQVFHFEQGQEFCSLLYWAWDSHKQPYQDLEHTFMNLLVILPICFSRRVFSQEYVERYLLHPKDGE